MKTFLIDDIREIEADVVARTFQDALKIAEANDITDWTLFLDHDLGNVCGFDGYEIIQYMIYENNVPKIVKIVSSNPVGRDNIGRALVNYGYIKRSPTLYERKRS